MGNTSSKKKSSMGNTPGFGVGFGLGLAVAAAAALIQASRGTRGGPAGATAPPEPPAGEQKVCTLQAQEQPSTSLQAQERHARCTCTSKPVDPKIGDKVVAPQYQYNTEDIDEYSAERLSDAKSYAKDNAMLIQVRVLGTETKTFWRLSDEATRISRKLALILRRHHSVRKRLTAPLQVSNVRIGSAGSVKLRGASFTDEGFSIERVRDDYRNLSSVLKELITISGGDINKLPLDYNDFLSLLTKDNLTTEDEFLIVNNAALLPLKNRTEVFLMLYDRIVKCLGRKNRAKRNRILSNLPYENDWLDTATANTKINQWVVSVQNKEYERTTHDLLRLNRNVRSHLHEYGHDDDVEEILYCEWPMLLIAMEKMLHLEGELQDTDIENKFG